jgi:thioredoxin reductase (NADPH)
MSNPLVVNLSKTSSSNDVQHEKVVIIGSGPAGLTAALYTARASLNPVVIAGYTFGGQVSLTYEIENYPGFPKGLTGQELVDLMKEQAERFGARIEMFTAVSEVDFSTPGGPFRIKTDNGKEYEAESVIVTAGANPRKLNIPGEDQYTGNGVSYCATCDGFFFREKQVVVVGGGDSALEEAIFLTRFATRVDVIHRRSDLRAGAMLQERAKSNPKIHFIWNTVVDEVCGDQKVKSVKLRNLETEQIYEYPTDGVFVFVGHDPNSDLFQDQLERDIFGYLVTDRDMRTNVEGVFAAGEVQDRIFRQVATSVGQGTAAAISCERWLAARE